MPTVNVDALDRAVALLRDKFAAVEAIYLFGSANRQALRADSDVDLAVLCLCPIPPEARFALEQECAQVLGTDVDLVDLRTAPLPLQAAIVAEGRALYVANPAGVAFFGNTILSRYCAFNEERRPFFAAVRERGAIHV